MKSSAVPSPHDKYEEINALVQVLDETHRRIQELADGELDSVTHSDGRSYLLHQAQESLRVSESAQRQLAATQSSILNALPAHIALVDNAGVILSVNEGWRNFGEGNGLQNSAASVGQNYLEICDQAHGARAEEAQEAAMGIRSVLGGSLSKFSLEYPCHSPTEQRWFQLMVSPMMEKGSGGAVVMHVNITGQRLAEEALRASATGLALAQEIAHFGSWELDLTNQDDVDANALQWSDEMFRIAGYEPSGIEINNQFFFSLVPSEEHAAIRKAISDAIGDRLPYSIIHRLIRPNKDERIVHERGQISFDEKTGKALKIVGTAHDITERRHAEDELEETKARHHSLFENMLEGYTFCQILYEKGVAKDYIYLEVNGVFEAQTGLKNVVGRKVSEVVPGMHEANPEQLEIYSRVAATGKPEQFETYAKMLDMWFSVSVYSHTRQHFIAVFDNITQRKHAEADLRMSQERSLKSSAQLAKVLNSSLDAICTFDAAGNFVQVSAACEKIWGYRPEELLGTPYLEKVLPEDRPLTIEAATRIMAGISTTRFENRYVRKDGSITHITWSARWSEEDQSMFCVARDDTERKGIEERVIQQAKLIDEARDAIIECDLEDRITFWNKGAKRLFGWIGEEVQGDLRHELFHLDELKFRDANHAVHATGEWNGEFQKTGRDGTVRTLDCRWTLLRDAHGEPRSVLSIDTDITERKKIENQFLRAQRMESIGTLAGGIAHDLNNALGPVIMSVELLSMRFPDPESQNLISIIGASAQRGADMVRQVLSFARGVEGERVETDIKHLIHDIEKIAQDTFLKHITVRTIIANDLWTVVGDSTQIHQVLLNLCVNARDAMPDGGSLILSAENCLIDEQYAGMNLDAKPGSYVVIEVEDTGSGMPPAVIEKIFEPFFTTKELGKGTGLGLSTSMAIVKSHGGFLRVYSESGKGTKFRVHLPASTEGSAETSSVAAQEMPRGHGELILVVDDESSVRLITRQTLEAFGYRVALASDGAEALAVFVEQRRDIAVVLTDMMMPIMDGAATIHALNKMSPGLPIIAASGLTENSTAAAARLGIRHFLSKPYTAPALLKVLQQILSTDKETRLLL